MEFEDEVKEMIDCHQEGDYLDFKEYDYQKDHKEELVKDILALANSHSIRNKYIIIGAVEENNACTKLREIDTKQIRDEAEFQQIINTYIYENLIVNYRILNIDGKNILVIQIPVINNSNRPFMVKKQIGKLKENEIYIRKGSTTSIANKKDLEYMFKENKNSKLVVQSYSDGNLFDKIQLSEVNSIIEKYKEKKFEKLKQLVNDINQLKGKEYSFGMGMSFLISNEVVKLKDEKENFLKEELKELNLEYEDSIFEFKNIRWQTTFNGGGMSPISKTLCGDKNEIERYWKLKELDVYILEYLAINYYFKGLPKIYNTNLVISNLGNYFDEDIELKLIIDKDVFIGKDTLIVKDDVIKYLGNMYNDLKEDLIKCPRVSSIDEYYYPAIATATATSSYIPSYIGAMYSSKQTYLEELKEKADDFKYDIEDIFENSIYEEDNKIIIKTDFKKLMHNKSMFLESKILFKSNKIKIDYEIRSKNSSKIIKESITS